MPWGLLTRSTSQLGPSRSNSFVAPGRHIEQPPRAVASTSNLSRYNSIEPSPLGREPQSTAATTPNDDSAASDSDRGPQTLSTRQTQPLRNRRFSLLKFRHASDSQLSASYRAAEPPPVPNLPTPTIIMTAPTMDKLDRPAKDQSPKKKSRHKLFSRKSHLGPSLEKPAVSSRSLAKASAGDAPTGEHVSFQEPLRLPGAPGAPPAYGDDSGTALALPVARLSESSRSDGSGDIYAQTTTTHTISTTTTLFRLPRRKKNPGPLFPLPVKFSSPSSEVSVTEKGPRASTSGRTPTSPGWTNHFAAAHYHEEERDNEHPSPLPSPAHSAMALTNAPLGSPGPAIFRRNSTTSHRSAKSSPSTTLPPPDPAQRGRSSTMGSSGKTLDHESPQLPSSGRTSTSTAGRKSIGDIFSLTHRFRQNSEPKNPRTNSAASPGTPGSTGSKQNSFQLPREVAYPSRAEGDTPAGYLERLEAAVPRGVVAVMLCKGSDEFTKTCLRKYMRGFAYFGESIDIAIRKMLMEVELPKETQQIDRLVQGFADRYCECNPGIFASTDEAYTIAFSILLLHSDWHNKNNKRKMQKADYVKNTKGEVTVSSDILECFYDSICYTPFIHFEDDVAINSHRLAAPKPRTSLFRTPSTDNLKGPVDPYALILDNKLDTLRPSLKDVMDTEDTYNARGTASMFDARDLHNAFSKAGVLQIVSARSRPDAFLNQATISNPAEAQAGLVSIRAAKVGLIWRKDQKKKKARSPWQEWGAVLTGSQLYFFQDVAWIKTLISQQDSHQKGIGVHVSPPIFRPPLMDFNPDALISMDDAVALLDTRYKKHKNAFIFIKHGGFEEVFLANSESDMNDWISKLNYAATFRTTGVRIRGHSRQDAQNYNAEDDPLAQVHSRASPNTSSNGDGECNHRTKLKQDFEDEIMAYRRQIMEDKIHEADIKLNLTQKELDNLLRNARHLQILSPIQAKTREALVLAAGRMSAKLKWTRVEMWRTRCHRDMLKLDMEEEVKRISATPISPTTSMASTSQKTTSLKLGAQTLTKSESRITDGAVSPQSLRSIPTPRTPSHIPVNRAYSADNSQHQSSDRDELRPRQPSINSLEQLLGVGDTLGDRKQDSVTPRVSPSAHALDHQSSAISSHGGQINAGGRLATPTSSLNNDGEERVFREAGLIGVDASSPATKRPDTSGSDRELVGVVAADATPRERGTGVRRSLQRTLRDSHHGQHMPHHHRSKKGRDSSSSVAVSEDGKHAPVKSCDGLARGTGSFTVHGKKASVITVGAEWQSMSNEDRMKIMKQARNAETRESALEDEDSIVVSNPSTVTAHSPRTNSTATARDVAEMTGEQESVRGLSERGSDKDERSVSGQSLFDIPIPSPELGHSGQLQAIHA